MSLNIVAGKSLRIQNKAINGDRNGKIIVQTMLIFDGWIGTGCNMWRHKWWNISHLGSEKAIHEDRYGKIVCFKRQ